MFDQNVQITAIFYEGRSKHFFNRLNMLKYVPLYFIFYLKSN